jgi:hypothetical protein
LGIRVKTQRLLIVEGYRIDLFAQNMITIRGMEGFFALGPSGTRPTLLHGQFSGTRNKIAGALFSTNSSNGSWIGELMLASSWNTIVCQIKITFRLVGRVMSIKFLPH